MHTGYQLNPEEQIIRRVKRHWIDLLSIYFVSGGLVAAAFGLAASTGFYSRLAPIVPQWAMGLAALILALLAVLILCIGIWVYRHNYLLITDQHLIEVKQIGLFGREVSQLNMARVQDVTARRRGFWPTILNYGDVIVQTAGESDEFSFAYIPKPQEIASLCLRIHEEYAAANADLDNGAQRGGERHGGSEQ